MILLKQIFSVSHCDQEDAYNLKIVEGYCDLSRSSKTTKNESSSYQGLHPPQLIVAEDEKILMEEMVGDEVVVKER